MMLTVGILTVACSENASNTLDESILTRAQRDEIQLKILPLNNVVKNQFIEFLLQEDTAEEISETAWDLDNLREYTSSSDSLYCYFTVDKNDSGRILAGCSFAKEMITNYYTLEGDGETFIFKDEFNCPICDITLNPITEEFTISKVYELSEQSSSRTCYAITLKVGTIIAKGTGHVDIFFMVGWFLISISVCR